MKEVQISTEIHQKPKDSLPEIIVCSLAISTPFVLATWYIPELAVSLKSLSQYSVTLSPQVLLGASLCFVGALVTYVAGTCLKPLQKPANSPLSSQELVFWYTAKILRYVTFLISFLIGVVTINSAISK